MLRGTLLPNTSEVELVCLRPRIELIEVELRTSRPFSCCPVCGTASPRVHSRYPRRLGDLPWEGIPVSILLQTRNFFCVVETCRRRIFTEPLSGTALRYSRRTLRSCEALDWITVMIGGQAGARLARRLGLLVSGSTLLRQLCCRARRAPVVAPRVLGIDDWAWRKGHRYGTILCDLESHRVIDLLPDREAGTVAAWLCEHPGSEIVSRDRGGIYAQATWLAAPGAVQVADRWHLLRNLSEALKNALSPHQRLLTQAARSSMGEVPGSSHLRNLRFRRGSYGPACATGSVASAATKRCIGWARQERPMLRSAGNWDSIIAPYASSSEPRRSPKRNGAHVQASSILMPSTSTDGLSRAAGTCPGCGANCGNEASRVNLTS